MYSVGVGVLEGVGVVDDASLSVLAVEVQAVVDEGRIPCRHVSNIHHSYIFRRHGRSTPTPPRNSRRLGPRNIEARPGRAGEPGTVDNEEWDTGLADLLSNR